VTPHVDRVSIPPRATVVPRDKANTSREPGKNVLYPDEQKLAVYMPGVPSADDSIWDTPLGPASGRTLERPRQIGGD
jgi:hypothetical protein